MPRTQKTLAPCPDRKSTVAEHLLNIGYEILFEKTRRLNTMTTYMDHMVKEAIQTQLHAKNVNGEAGFILSQ
jgi:hypothetical protein